MRRKALRHLLLRLGFARVHEAEDAVSAAALASQELVDVAFVPWSMDGLTGPELFAALRPRGHKAAPAFVVLDEGMSRPAAVAAVKAGASGRLALPPNEAALARLIEEIPGDPAAERGSQAGNAAARRD